MKTAEKKGGGVQMNRYHVRDCSCIECRRKRELTSPESHSQVGANKTIEELDAKYLQFCKPPYTTGGANIVVRGEDLELLLKYARELNQAREEIRELSELVESMKRDNGNRNDSI